MGNTSTDWVQMSNGAIIQQLGDYIRHLRLQQNKTQAELAEIAGLNRWTISQIENGESITLMSLIQILRALDSLYVLKSFEYSDEISPLEYAKLKRQQKQRARNKPTDSTDKDNLEW
jgi:transcriptional regulator with XRE-family HTH domain